MKGTILISAVKGNFEVRCLVTTIPGVSDTIQTLEKEGYRTLIVEIDGVPVNKEFMEKEAVFCRKLGVVS